MNDRIIMHMVPILMFLVAYTDALSYKGAWQVLTPYGPTERSHASLECIEGSVFVHGGVVNKTILSDIWVYHVNTSLWVQFFTGGPIPRLYGASLRAGDLSEIYVFGGNNGAETLSDMVEAVPHRFSPRASAVALQRVLTLQCLFPTGFTFCLDWDL